MATLFHLLVIKNQITYNTCFFIYDMLLLLYIYLLAIINVCLINSLPTSLSFEFLISVMFERLVQRPANC